jgi:hypothetical protein
MEGSGSGHGAAGMSVRGLGTALGALALMVGAVCLLTVWVFQHAGHATHRHLLAAHDPARGVGPQDP